MSYAERYDNAAHRDEHVDDTDAERVTTFTGRKLDWLNVVSADRKLKPAAFEVAFCIVQHVNAKTLIAILSDDVIVEKTGISRAEVERHRKSLKAAGWLTWRRTRSANNYTPLFDNMNAARDVLAAMREDRRERRAKRAARTRDFIADSSPAMDQASSPTMKASSSPAMNIHHQYYTLDVTPSKKRPSIEHPFLGVSDPEVAVSKLIEVLGDGDRDLGHGLAKAIGINRFRFLLNEMMSGTLFPSAVHSAVAFGSRNINAGAGSSGKYPDP
jgi:hypothetical protein